MSNNGPKRNQLKRMAKFIEKKGALATVIIIMSGLASSVSNSNASNISWLINLLRVRKAADRERAAE